MEINIPLFNKISLMIANNPGYGGDYPTGHLQKGLLLSHAGQNLAEEAVGFGVPILKQGLRTIFAGDIEISSRVNGSFRQVTAIYKMNLQEKIGRKYSGNIRCNLIHSIKNFLAALHRNLPGVRGLFNGVSSQLRIIFGLETRYEPADFCTKVKVIYSIYGKEARVVVDVESPDLSELGITEVVMMNEQGANYFNTYSDSEGALLKGKKIGSWDEVRAEKASFICASQKTMFTLTKITGSKLFRGQELIGSRLAWSGFGYSFSPLIRNFHYEVKLEKI
jgi:hypothetical protein